jgi:peptidyl-prolyl cis-trans isomerase C
MHYAYRKRKREDLGEFRRGHRVTAFDDVVKKPPIKRPLLTVHGFINTKFGYHLIKTLYRK